MGDTGGRCGIATLVKLAKLLVPLGLDADEFNKGLEGAEAKAKSSTSGIVGGLSSVASVGLAAGAAGLAAVGAAAVGGIAAMGEWTDKVDTIGDALGTSAEEGSGLATMMQIIGGDTEELTKQLVFMGKGLEDGKGGLGKTGEALSALGISIYDANGQMRSATQIFGDAATVIGQMPDGLEKTNTMMSIFGKSGAGMSDALNAAANGGMQAYIEKSKALGLSLSDDASAGAIEFGKSMEEVKLMGQGLFVTIGSSLIPILTPLLKQFTEFAVKIMPDVTDVIKTVVKWIGDNLVPTLSNLIKFILPGLQAAIKFVVDHWQIFVGIAAVVGVAILALTSPISLIVAAVVALALAWSNNWGGIQDKVKAVADWLSPYIKGALDMVSGVFDLFKLAFQGDWEAFGAKLRELFNQAWENIKLVVKNAWTWFTNIDWGAVGRAVVQGIANGITSAIDWAIRAIMNLGSAVISAIKGFLGIHSPSEKFRKEVGWMMGEGIIKGFRESLNGLNANVDVGSVSRVTSVRPVVVNMTYAPMMSLADRDEAENVLTPFIAKGVRLEMARMNV